MEVVTLRLPKDLLDEIDAEAEEADVSRSEYVRQVLESRDDPNTGPNTDATGGLECHSCGYIWEYEGDLPRATCPACGTKVHVDQD